MPSGLRPKIIFDPPLNIPSLWTHTLEYQKKIFVQKLKRLIEVVYNKSYSKEFVDPLIDSICKHYIQLYLLDLVDQLNEKAKNLVAYYRHHCSLLFIVFGFAAGFAYIQIQACH
jgi:hypothetical protein